MQVTVKKYKNLSIKLILLPTRQTCKHLDEQRPQSLSDRISIEKAFSYSPQKHFFAEDNCTLQNNTKENECDE